MIKVNNGQPYTQVSAIEFVRNDIFMAAIGPRLEVFADMISVGQYVVLPGARIHGIRMFQSVVEEQRQKFVCFGSKYLAFCSYEADELRLLSRVKAKDWIKDVLWNVNELILVYAHNDCEVWSIEGPLDTGAEYVSLSAAGWSCVKRKQNKERCLIYCARIYGTCSQDVLIASGTVFNEVLIWDLNDDSDEVDNRHRLCGHEGVLFGIRFVASKDNYYVTSVSDDRTVRQWLISKDSAIHLWTIFGHSGRVWDAFYDHQLKLITSICEDGFLRIFDVSSKSATLVYEKDASSPLWSLALNADISTALVGGNGSVVKMFDTSSIFGRGERPFQESVLEGFDECRNISIIDHESLVVASNDGTLAFVTKKDRMELIQDKVLAKYQCFSNSLQLGCEKIWVVGDAKGLIRLFAGPRLLISEFLAASKKVCVLSLSKESDKVAVLFIVYINSYSNADSEIDFVYRFRVELDGTGMIKMQKLSSIPFEFSPLLLTKRKSPCHVSFVKMVKIQGRYVVLAGMCNGSLSMHLLSEEDYSVVDTLVLSSIHDHDSVTDALIQHEHGQNFIYSCGRDGYIAKHELRVLDGVLSALLIERVKAIRGTLETIHLSQSSRIVTVGTHLHHLLVLAYPDLEELCTFSCGGSGKKWCSAVIGDKLKVAVVSRKNVTQKDVLMNNSIMRKSSDDTLFPRFYCSSRECRFGRLVKFGGTFYLFSGGEDTIINISQFINEDLLLRKTVLRIHISAVNDISLYQINGSSHLLFSCGACEQLICNTVEHSNGELTLVRYRSSCPKVSAINDTRIMGIDSFGLTSDFVCVLGAYSDAYLRAWVYSITLNKWYLIGEQKYSDHCALNVQHFCYSTRHLAVVSYTNGNAHCVDITGNLQKFDSNDLRKCNPKFQSFAPTYLTNSSVPLRLHQSGINCCHIIECRQYDYHSCSWIASGGDDNALCITLFNRDCMEVIAQHTSELAHSSAIKGVRILHYKERTIVVSSSIDQRVNFWEVAISLDGILRVQLKKSVYVDIADISDLDIIENRDGTFSVSVVGFGLQFLALKIV